MAFNVLIVVICFLLTINASNDTRIPTPNDFTYNGKCSSVEDKDLFFAILFYDDPYDEMRHRVAINAAIDVAVQRVQAPGGLLAGFNITTEYRDSRSSSLHGALAAWDFHHTNQPGSSHLD